MLVPEGLSAHQRLAWALDELDETVFLADVEDGPVLRFSAVLGRSLRGPDGEPVDVVGQRVEDVLGEGGASRAYHWWMEALRTGEPQTYRGGNTGPDGTPRIVEVQVLPSEDRTHVAGIVRDVTTEEAALRRARERDAFSRSVLDAISTATAVLDGAGTVHAINAAWVRGAADPDSTVPLPGDDFTAAVGHVAGAADATRAILAGDDTPFSADFVEGERTFNLRIAPFEMDGAPGAIVSRSDITLRISEQQAIDRTHRRWQAAFASASIGLGLIDAQGRVRMVNPEMCRLFGYSEAELLALDPFEMHHPDDPDLRDQLLATTGSVGLERRYIRKDGGVIWVWLTWSRVEDADVSRFFVQMQDIGPRKRVEARLADHQRLLALVASGAPLAEVLKDVAAAGESHLPGSRWVVAVVGGSSNEQLTAVGLDDRQARELDDAYRSYVPSPWPDAPGVIILPPDGGTPLGAALRLGGSWTLPITEDADRVSGFIVVNDPPETPEPEDLAMVEQMGSVVRIALQRDAATRQLAERLLEDNLTGLPSRTLFHTRAEQALARIGHGSRGVAVLSIDLDRFGRINESLGHLAGDRVLVEIARRLRDLVPAPDTVARGGGDEFLVLLEDVADEEGALAVAAALLADLRAPMAVEGVEVCCPASIGVVFEGEPGRTVETLEGDAALAMTAAKVRGYDRVELFSDGLRSTMPRLDLERELQQAVDGHQFVVHFQPEIDLATNRIVGVEALVRWDHPERGLLPPAEFVGAAEETGAIIGMGRQVLAESCARLAEWSTQVDGPLTVAVNLSARQLADTDLVDFITATLAEHGIDPSQLVLEMTESTLVDDDDRARSMFEELRALGVRVGIDDFGTGYSSLLYLKRFPADLLKIDRSFVDGLGKDPGDSAIVAAVVRLAHRLELAVIAEGVETVEQLAHLRRLGCDYGQGFLWGRPVPADEMLAMLRTPLPAVAAVTVAPLDSDDPQQGELDDLLSVLTHELSTPLTVIGGYAELLAGRLGGDEDDGDGARTGVAAIERSVHNLGRMVAALADARGIDTGGTTVTLDAVPFVEQVVAELAPVLTAHPCTLKLEVETALVAADPVGLGQILTNVVGNAAKFTEPGTPIEVVVGREGEHLRVEVVDHGPGVPAERVDELFGRFARLGSTRRGLGLGLYLSRSIAQRHSGDIVHRPTPGGGATFVVTLPVSTEAR